MANISTSLENHLQLIIAKLNNNSWANKNPNSKNQIQEFLGNCVSHFVSTPGYIQVLKSISQDLNNKDSIKWLNYLSQIRCAYFLQSHDIKITAFEKKVNGKVLDLQFDNNILCEVKSFKAQLSRSKEAMQLEEFVFNNFLNNKLIPAFEVQKTDLLIVDDIFSDNSKNYRFLNYFLSFVGEPDTDRYAMIKSQLGKYLPKILILSFTQSMTLNPTKRFMGQEWKKLLQN